MNGKTRTGRKPTEQANMNTGVATTNTKALDALEMVRERIRAIKVISDAPPRTNGMFKYNPTVQNAIIVGTVTNVAELLHILGFVLEKENMYNAAADKCVMKEYPAFTWCGYSAADWTHDIRVRVAIINHHNNLSQLETAERELSGFLSQDDKLTMLLSKLGNLLG